MGTSPRDEHDLRDLRRRADADGRASRAEAAIHVELRVAHVVAAVQVAHERAAGDEAGVDLAAVGVTAQLEIDPAPDDAIGRPLLDSWIPDEDRSAIEAAGGRYIDIAVMGGFFKSGIKAPMLVAGEDVEPVVAWMNAHGFDAKALGLRPGSASSVKMLRSVIMKGIEALAVESFVAAERQGILKEVMGCLGDVDATTFSGSLAMLLQTHIVHAERRWEEMGLVAQTLRETGVEPLMTEAIEKSHRRTVEAHIAPADGKVPPLDAALKILSEQVVRGR